MSEKLNFVFPVDGDCLNANDGRMEYGIIYVSVKVEAEENHEVVICGKKADYRYGVYTCEVPVSGHFTTLTAEDKTSGENEKINVFLLNNPVGKYRLSSDDNILCFKDLTDNKDKYTSIFDNPYLAVYKKAHDLYGAKVHLNLFYEFIPTDDFKEHTEYFNLSMMTDKYRDEFEACSDWLKLAFHAKTEYPDAPYKYATAEEITNDCIKVCREIIRFAGKKSMNDTTTIHWGEANRDCVRALRNLGFRALTGYLTFDANKQPLVSYYLDSKTVEHVNERDFWYDKSEDMMFARIDVVLNLNTYQWAMNEVKEAVHHPGRGGFISLMIHEQYFHADYRAYEPDFEKRVLDACKYLKEHGYSGSHICEMTQEKHLCDNELFR